MSNNAKPDSGCAVEGLVGYFEVMRQTGEYDWEQLCGPYATYADAENKRVSWGSVWPLNDLQVVQFFKPNPTPA